MQRVAAWSDPPTEPVKLPTIEDLNLPREVLLAGVPLQYLRMFWAVWRRRGCPEDEITDRFWKQVHEVPPAGKVPHAYVMKRIEESEQRLGMRSSTDGRHGTPSNIET